MRHDEFNEDTHKQFWIGNQVFRRNNRGNNCGDMIKVTTQVIVLGCRDTGEVSILRRD